MAYPQLQAGYQHCPWKAFALEIIKPDFNVLFLNLSLGAAGIAFIQVSSLPRKNRSLSAHGKNVTFVVVRFEICILPMAVQRCLNFHPACFNSDDTIPVYLNPNKCKIASSFLPAMTPVQNCLSLRAKRGNPDCKGFARGSCYTIMFVPAAKI
jgi:hypothetical protein